MNILTNLLCQLTDTTLIGLDNHWATICVFNNQTLESSQYLLNHIHTARETAWNTGYVTLQVVLLLSEDVLHFEKYHY